MKISLLKFLLCLTLSSAVEGQTVLVEDDFTYPNGLLDAVGTGGSGWNVAEGGWQTGNSNPTANRFEIVSNAALYQGGGSLVYTEQGRTFATPATASTTEILEVSFTLLLPETQAGRGVGIYLSDLGTKRFFIGKQVNGGVGLHTTMASGNSLEFSSTATSETITATFSFDGLNTSMVLSDSDEELPAQTYPGAFSFDHIILAGYNAATTTNGIDDLLVTESPAPDPWLVSEATATFAADGSAQPFSLPISNRGAANALTITSITPTGTDAGAVSGLTFPASLAAMSSGTIDFTFTPNFGSGPYGFDLEVVSNDANVTSPFIISVALEVIDPVITVDTTPVDLGSFANNPGPQTSIVTITNDGGGAALEIEDAFFTGSEGFTVGALPSPIAPGASADLTVTFDPGTRPGNFESTLTIFSNDYDDNEPQITFTASTAFFGEPLARYDFEGSTPLASKDFSGGSIASNLIETDAGSRTEFGLFTTNATSTALNLVEGSALGWSRREVPNNGLDLSMDTPTESLAFTLSPGGGVSLQLATHGFLTLDVSSYSTIGGNTGYNYYLSVDSGGPSPTIIGPVTGTSIPGVGEERKSILFDLRSLGTVTTPLTLAVLPQSTGATNGANGQAGGYLDNIRLSGEEVVPTQPTLFTAASYNFTDEGLGSVLDFTVTNTGGSPLTITSVTTDGSAQASTFTDILFDSLLATEGGAGVIDFIFTPDAGPGVYRTNFVITSNDPMSPRTVAIQVTVLDPEITITRTSHDFGVFAAGAPSESTVITVTNSGEAADLSLSGTTFTGEGATSYSATIPGSIAPGKSGDIVVTFNPGVADGPRNAIMSIQSNDSRSSQPQVSFSAFVEPVRSSGIVVARYDFDGPKIAGATVDEDATLQTSWATTNLTDQATGNGALSTSNQGGSNRILASGPSGNYLALSSNREGDAATPVAAGGNNESTWTTFTITPQSGGGAVDYTNGSATVETFAFAGIASITSADWTLYYSTDGGTTWIPLETLAGANSLSGLEGPTPLSWDLTALGIQSAPVQFALDPVTTGGDNGSVTQRHVGFDNLEVIAGSSSTGSPGFSGWASANGVSGEGDDSDGDGLAALLEYALGLDPNAADGNSVTFDGTTVSFTKGAEAVTNGDLNYGIETSSDLGQTDPWTAVTPSINNTTTISYNLPAGAGKIFARLSVTLYKQL